MRVCIINGDYNYTRMFYDRQWKVVPKLWQADLIQFCGGGDVSPHLYGEDPHPTSVGINIKRDTAEQLAFRVALGEGIAMAGICRGGQFLNVMNKGRLWQDVDNHQKPHEIHDVVDNRVINVTSTHHQAMIPGPRVTRIASCKWKSSYQSRMMGKTPYTTKGVNTCDEEVLFYAHSKSLCFQPHPEIKKGECMDYYFYLLEKYLKLK